MLYGVTTSTSDSVSERVEPSRAVYDPRSNSAMSAAIASASSLDCWTLPSVGMAT